MSAVWPEDARPAFVQSAAGIIQSRSLDDILESGPFEKVLSGGRLVSAVGATGATRVTFGDFALNTWRGDAPAESGAYFVYLQDLESGGVWSAGLQPCTEGCEAYVAEFESQRVCLRRLQEGVRTSMIIRLGEGDYEIRELTLRNETDAPRRLRVTSYVELALNDWEVHAAHPAFSKLFLQTSFDSPTQTIRAWRRKRSPDERTPLVMHFAGGDGTMHAFETSRPDFLGRGHTIREPAALMKEGAMVGREGSVLDPILAISRDLYLPPGGDATLFFVLGAGWSAEDFTDMGEAYRRSSGDGDGHGPRGAESAAEHREGAARKVARAVQGGLAYGMLGARPTAPQRAWRATAPEDRPPESGESLQFFNGHGGFTASGDEYVIRIEPDEDGRPALPPQPWTNVIANEELGFIVSETGAGCTWSANSREHRLTPWFNDPVVDPHGEALYVRAEEAGRYWSLMSGPAPAPTRYEVRHGLGYTVFRHTYGGLDHETRQFAARDDPVKITHVRLRNASGAAQTISLFAYHELVLGADGGPRPGALDVRWSAEHRALLARNPLAEGFSRHTTFVAARGEGWEQRFTTSRRSFLGRFPEMDRPYALEHVSELKDSAGDEPGGCAVLQLRITIPPGEERECAILLGSAAGEENVAQILARFAGRSDWRAALEEVRSFWTRTTGRLQIETPAPEIDLLVNRWLPYQNLSCRMRGRTAFYQSGGAFGYRDQLQDAAALVYLDPGITRRQILLHAARQFAEGDVLHWWHPTSGKGIRTRFSDDLLWLPYVAASYARTTGDAALLDQPVPFLQGPQLAAGEDEILLTPEASGEEGTVYEHCCRALDRSLTAGTHDLPLMGSGDWNDGMNRVGRQGEGESVWLGFFIYHILGRFIPICEERDDPGRAARYGLYRARLEEALNDAGWDGEWYRRAYYDDGQPLGSRKNDECRIDALSQAWAVISGAAPEDRARMALDAVERELVDEEAGIIRLLTPAFDKTPHDPGYIRGYVPGVRENGGQYTHGVLWIVRALAEAGRGARAAALLTMLSPVSHTKSAEAVERYRVEPYVVAADVYGEPPHAGRGGWTWYTGSAGWMWRIAVESILGFRLENGVYLTIEPSIPEAWDHFSIRYHVPGTESAFVIGVRNPNRRTNGVCRVVLDGQELPCDGRRARIPMARDGRRHEVEITM